MVRAIKTKLIITIVLLACGVLGAAISHSGATGSPSGTLLPVDLCFVRDNGVWVRKANTLKEELWYSGDSIMRASISPKGDAVVLAGRFIDGRNNRIALLDDKNMKPRILDGIPDGSCGNPIWSLDGNHIIFTIYTTKIINSKIEAKTDTAIISRNGTGFKIVGKVGTIPLCWTNEIDSIYVTDLQKICKLALNRNESICVEPVSKTFNYLGADSAALSPNGKFMLLRADICPLGGTSPFNDETILLLLDLTTKKAERLSPPKTGMNEPCWLPDGKSFLYHAYSEKKGHRIEQMELKTRRKTVIVDDGLCPSLSR